MAELEITESDATIIDSELIIAEEDESFGEFKAMIEDQPMRNLYEFMQMGQLCDASLKIDDGSTILVHRNILAACSLYFRSIFTTPLHDKDLFHVNLTNVTREIVDEILTYVYMRKVNINKNNVYNLIIAADYLGISSLLEICCSVLESQLTSSNCIGIMKFAVCYFCTDLAKASETFILRNFTEVAFDNADLLRLDLNEFKAIVSHDELNVKHEELVWETILKWINYDEENRKQHVVTLMKTIRLGLLDTQFFLENVKDHPYVATVEESRPLIIDTLKFLYDLEMISYRSYECPTPELARPRIPHEVLFVIGGWSGGSPTNYMETYDTRADRWVKVEEVDPAGPRAYHGTAVVGFCIYVVGGFDGMDYFNSCRCFNAVARRWREVAPMHARRCYVSVTTLNDLIYAMGGYDGHHRQNTAEKYDYKSNQWTMISPMNMQRSDASACSLNDKIYITGGFNGQECMNSAECYDPEFNQWTIITGMRSRRSGVSCVAYHDFVYVVGGFNGISRMVSGERYDPATNLWSQIPDMYNPRSNFAIEVIDDMIFAIGGFNGVTTIYHVECYDEKANDWYEATDMTIYRSALSASAIVGLPNLHDYIHKHRDRLMEEKRLKMQMATLGSHRQIIGANINPNNNNNNHLNMTPPQPVIGAAAAQLVQILGEERPDIDLQELADELQHELDNEPFGLYPGPLEEPPDDDGELPDLFAADGQEIDAEIQPSALPIMGEIVLEEIIQGEIVQAEIVQGEIVQGEIVIPPIEIIATSLPSADDEMDYFYDFLNETDDSGEESEESSEEESTDSNSMEENNHYRDEEDNTGDGDSNLDNNSQNNESESEIRSLNSRQIISDTDSAVINDHQTTDHDTDSQNQTESDNNYYMIMPSITVHITRYIPPSEIIVHSESSMDENTNSN